MPHDPILPADSSEEEFDEFARAAGRALRRPAADDGVASVRIARRRQRAVRAAAATSAVAVLVTVVGVLVVGSRDDGRVATIPAGTPSIAGPSTQVPPTTTKASAPAASSSAPTTVSPTTVSPATTEPVVDVATVFAGWEWGDSGIGRTCGDVWWQQQQMNQRRCTEIVIDPQGVPVSYDPVSRRVVRERRESTGLVAFTLPDEYVDVSLLAAGPDDVVYFALDNDWPTPSDVAAFSLAPDDMGRLIERFGAVLPVGDADVFPTTAGLVVSGWYDPGPRPSSDGTPAVAWAARDGGAVPWIPSGEFDDANSMVAANGWQWNIEGRRVVAEQPGTSAVAPTFDGGFIAAYTDTSGSARTELIRGWRDGTVDLIELPAEWADLGGPLILEPHGTLLVPNGDSFARVAPFDDPPNGWDGELQIDVEAGTAAPIGLDDHLDTLEWPIEGQSHVWPWGTDLIAFADAVADGSSASPTQLRTIHQGPIENATTVVIVTTEGVLDDSVHGTRLVMHISLDQPGFRIIGIDWSNTCKPDRGHQDYRAEPCT